MINLIKVKFLLVFILKLWKFVLRCICIIGSVYSVNCGNGGGSIDCSCSGIIKVWVWFFIVNCGDNIIGIGVVCSI